MQKNIHKAVNYVRLHRFDRRLIRHFDWILFLTVCALVLFGALSIYSATSIPVNQEINSWLEMIRYQPFTYLRLQVIWFVAGLILMSAVLYFHYDLYARMATLIYWGNIALLVLVLFMERGRGNMAGWFAWGSGRTFQPSEIGKLAIIIAMAKVFADRKEPIKTVKELIPVLAYIGLPLILIVLQPDVGTALVYVAIFAGMMFLSGTSPKLLFGMICLAVILAILLLQLMSSSGDSFRYDRILVFLNPDLDPNGAGLNAINSRIAIGSGGFWGKGLFAEGSFAALNYIPEDHTDFIFAIVCETFGFVGAMVMVGLFGVLLFRMLWFTKVVTDPFGRYVIVGVMSMILFHVLENIGMVIGLLPITGIPLPFVSYGGSNMLTNMAGVGLVLNVIMREKAKVHQPARRRIGASL